MVTSLEEVDVCPDGVGFWLLVQVLDGLPVALRVHLEERLVNIELLEVALIGLEFFSFLLVLLMKQVSFTLEALHLRLKGL